MFLTNQIILFIPVFLSLGTQYRIKTNKLPTKEHTFQLQLKIKTSRVWILTYGWKSVEAIEALQSFTGLSEPIIVSQPKMY